MAVTLKDIAEQTGVSTTTVSRILNGRESGLPIREETRQKVLAAAAQLGYRPNLMARALRGSRSSLIGVLAQNVTSQFHSQILRGLNDAAVQRAYRVFLGYVQRQVDMAVDYGSRFEQSHADGILIIGELHGSEELVETLMHQHHFIVGVTDRIARRTFPGVYADSVIGTQLALNHLWDLGHRKIICVSDPKLQDGVRRTEVYEQFMREHGAQAHIRIYNAPRTFQGSYEAGREIFASFNLHDPDCPTAIFATTDTCAVGLLQAAFQANIQVPQQISVVGYDDLDIAPFTIPPLTTISQSGVQMGQAAADMLISMIEQERQSEEVEDIILTPHLVIRQSTSAPRTS